jgi:hypothetical protein
VYILQSFQQRVDESIRAAEGSRVDSPVAFNSDDQRNSKFCCSLPERRVIGVQDRCKSREADAGGRLLPDQRIV